MVAEEGCTCLHVELRTATPRLVEEAGARCTRSPLGVRWPRGSATSTGPRRRSAPSSGGRTRCAPRSTCASARATSSRSTGAPSWCCCTTTPRSTPSGACIPGASAARPERCSRSSGTSSSRCSSACSSRERPPGPRISRSRSIGRESGSSATSPGRTARSPTISATSAACCSSPPTPRNACCSPGACACCTSSRSACPGRRTRPQRPASPARRSPEACPTCSSLRSTSRASPAAATSRRPPASTARSATRETTVSAQTACGRS